VHGLEECRAVAAHHDNSLGEANERVHHGALHGIWLGEDRVERRDDRHPEIAQELEHVPARLGAEDSVLVLDGNDVDGLDVEKIGSPSVRGDVTFGDLETDARWVRVLCADVVHREDEAVELRHLAFDGVAEIRGERCDPAMSRQVIAEHRDGVDGPLPAAVFSHDPSIERGSRPNSARAPVVGMTTTSRRPAPCPRRPSSARRVLQDRRI
jgi:hypothetical protein